MTRYTVVWHGKAQDQIAELWLQAEDRRLISTSTNTIDQELTVDPELKGTLVVPGYRELIVSPLRIVFSVSEADRLVKVLLVTAS
jgi:mRNA-degrading endonuclease RelE of RelBE toxin-antitoxin system